MPNDNNNNIRSIGSVDQRLASVEIAVSNHQSLMEDIRDDLREITRLVSQIKEKQDRTFRLDEDVNGLRERLDKIQDRVMEDRIDAKKVSFQSSVLWTIGIAVATSLATAVVSYIINHGLIK